MLSSLVELTVLYLGYNSISDITPLVMNEGIGTDDSVAIDANALDCDDPITQNNLSTLFSRGVNLSYQCN